MASADQDSELQALLAAVVMPQAVLDLAAGRGFVIEWDALREASRELLATYWPWAAKGT